MQEAVEQVLQKIHFIERDMELHKKILVSLPAEKTEEMERVVAEIARMKARVDELKGSLAELDPETHSQVMRLEEGTRKFQEMSKEKNLLQVFTLDQLRECVINLVDGSQIECLVKAVDDKGGWIGLTQEGEVVEYSVEEVMEL